MKGKRSQRKRKICLFKRAVRILLNELYCFLRKWKRRYPHGFAVICSCVIVALAVVAGCRIFMGVNHSKVYAAEERQAVNVQQNVMPSGLAGVISGVWESEYQPDAVARIGTSCEEVIVGQRLSKIHNETQKVDMSAFAQSAAENLNSQSMTMAAAPKMMSDTDYDTLLHIVEAESGGEDIKGRIMVANVIMNRVESPQFPDSVTEVVWDTEGGYQFSPTYDGRIGTVEISPETEDAVRQALEGTDYSQGALFFVAKDQAAKENVDWFERDLKKLFEHGVHTFYTYPDGAKE